MRLESSIEVMYTCCVGNNCKNVFKKIWKKSIVTVSFLTALHVMWEKSIDDSALSGSGFVKVQ